jgi:ElaB/YqjD/DUF883 family membrane-anchored ribosome-binding protein
MATTPKPNKDAEPEAEPSTALGTEIAALREDMRDLAAHVARIGKTRASGLKSVADAKAGDAMATGEATLQEIVGELRSLEEELSDATRRRPLTAIGLAALAGYFFGILTRR